MATVKPFRAVRPTPELAPKVTAHPYDVMNYEEACEMVKGNPYSYLHVDRSEVDLPPETDHYSQVVYEKAAANLYQMKKDGILLKEDKPCFYVWRQIMNGRAQTGIVACASINDYMDNVIKKHELTRAEKEEDRCNHVDFCNANTGVVFLAYRARKGINDIVAEAMKNAPLYDFGFEDVQQTVWVISNPDTIAQIEKEFGDIESLYIADGHHRSASAVRIGRKRRAQNPDYTGDEEFNYFLCVLFPDEQLYCMDYNRVVADLNGLSKDEFLTKISEKFDVQKLEKSLGNDEQGKTDVQQKHTFGMYADGQWYLLTAKPGTFDANDIVEQLDVAILQKNLLSPVLGISDPRVDKRIDFVGGIRGLKELEKRVDGGAAVAFAKCPTSMSDLFAIADEGKIMPPKSTWFEPKLLSGIFVHELR